MPDDLLLELETPTPVAESLDSIELLVPVVARQVGWAVAGMQGSARLFENAWRAIIRNVASGQTAAMQALRSRLLRALEERLRLLKETHNLGKWLQQRGGAQIPSPDVLLPEIVGIERLKASVFDRWETADDLEDLAARDYPLTTADLDRIGPQRRPPASYYAEATKPF